MTSWASSPSPACRPRRPPSRSGGGRRPTPGGPPPRPAGWGGARPGRGPLPCETEHRVLDRRVPTAFSARKRGPPMQRRPATASRSDGMRQHPRPFAAREPCGGGSNSPKARRAPQGPPEANSPRLGPGPPRSAPAAPPPGPLARGQPTLIAGSRRTWAAGVPYASTDPSPSTPPATPTFSWTIS